MKRSIMIYAIAATLASVMTASAAVPLVGGEKILFVGNSLTNNGGGLWNFVTAALAAGTPSITITTDNHIEFATELSAIYANGNAANKIRNGGYDIVVLQGWIEPENGTAGDRAKFVRSVKDFDAVIKASGAQTALFMNPCAITQGTSYGTITNIIASSYDSAFRVVGTCPVAPCANAHNSFQGRPPLYQNANGDTSKHYPRELLYADAIHPNKAAHFLNAYCFYRLLTGRSPQGLRFTAADTTLDPYLDSILQYKANYFTNMWVNQHRLTPVLQQVEAKKYGAPLGIRMLNNAIMVQGIGPDVSGLQILGMNGRILGSAPVVGGSAIVTPAAAGTCLLRLDNGKTVQVGTIRAGVNRP